MRTRQIRVNGRVQGVGFRDALCAEALRLRVSGWVRNRADGSVEALLQGDEAAVERLVTWARRGPALARVEALEEKPVEAGYERAYFGFERWPTA
jgi:acylphosphatase